MLISQCVLSLVSKTSVDVCFTTAYVGEKIKKQTYTVLLVYPNLGLGNTVAICLTSVVLLDESEG